jgi:hypothetical protein
MPPWYRVFGTSPMHPEPSTLLDGLRARGFEAAGHFRGDDQGWFHADLVPATGGPAVEVDCYLSSEEGIRNELNSWAAWLEATGDENVHACLMQHLISTTRLFTVHSPEGRGNADPLCVALCELLAVPTAGVYQIDGRGFFAADGALLVAED